MLSYEYPLNERIRTLLRLESLFNRFRHFQHMEARHEHHAALLTLFEILDVANRSDLKIDIIQELERIKQWLESLRSNPDVAENSLRQVLQNIDNASTALLAMSGKNGQYLRDHEWLMTLRARATVPGGMCGFDLPAYQYWGSGAAEKRQQDLQTWLTALQPLEGGGKEILTVLRGSGNENECMAQGGVFQLMLGDKNAQLLSVRLPRNSAIPEISANKYALNIQFTQPQLSNLKPGPCEQNIPFILTFYGI